MLSQRVRTVSAPETDLRAYLAELQTFQDTQERGMSTEEARPPPDRPPACYGVARCPNIYIGSKFQAGAASVMNI